MTDVCAAHSKIPVNFKIVKRRCELTNGTLEAVYFDLGAMPLAAMLGLW